MGAVGKYLLRGKSEKAMLRTVVVPTLREKAREAWGRLISDNAFMREIAER
jgi:hypothetical protein